MITITDIVGPDVEQDWQNETTRYWFTLELDCVEEQFAIAYSNGRTSVLDADGAPLTEGDELTVRLRNALMPLMEVQS